MINKATIDLIKDSICSPCVLYSETARQAFAPPHQASPREPVRRLKMATQFPITANPAPSTEIWRKIDGYSHYEVSDLGRVRSFAQNLPRIMKPGLASNGYLTVSLWRANKGRTHCVHSLVADAFLGRSVGLDVDHIDHDRTNNRISNIRYATSQENRGIPNAKKFTLVSPSGATVMIENLSKFCRQHGLNRASMGGVVQGRMVQYKGWGAA